AGRGGGRGGGGGEGAEAGEGDRERLEAPLPLLPDPGEEHGPRVASAHPCPASRSVRACLTAVSGIVSPASIRAISATRSLPSTWRMAAIVRPRASRFSAR